MLAQMTRDELNESETFSHIYVCQQMEMRKRYVEDCNRILGTNIEVDYGCAWKHFKAGEVSSDEFISGVVSNVVAYLIARYGNKVSENIDLSKIKMFKK